MQEAKPHVILDLAYGAALGASLAAPPGPMNAIIADQSTRFGWKAGVRVGLAAPVVDTLFLLLFVAGFPRLVDIDSLLRPASALGAGLMAYFAVGTARASGEPGTARVHTFWGVFLLSATNPFQLAWWASGGTALLAKRGLWGAAGFLVAIYTWVFVLANVTARGAARWEWFQPAVQVLSADLLLVFALVLATNAL